MTTPYSPAAVANEFLERARKDGKAITPMQLIKLTYIAHGWYLAVNNTPLINEPIEAWKFGPVIPSLFHEFKEFKGNPIRRLSYARTNDSWDEESEFDVEETFVPSEDTDTIKLLDWVWKSYGHFSGAQLSNLTHNPGTPWARRHTESQSDVYSNVPIPDEEIRKHYLELWATRSGK